MSNESKLTRENNSLNISFPSNGESQPKTLEERGKLSPVVKGKVIKRKKGFMERMKESICGGDEQSVGDYILYDILVPALKSTIADMVTGGIDMLMFGESRRKPNNVRRDGMRSYVSYNAYYNGNNDNPQNVKSSSSLFNKSTFEDVIFSSRGEAEDILSKLSENIEEYSLVSVADYYDLCGLQSNYTDNRYGWTSLREAFTERVRDGYIIRLPRPKPIN